jgi:hypothetical protein
MRLIGFQAPSGQSVPATETIYINPAYVVSLTANVDHYLTDIQLNPGTVHGRANATVVGSLQEVKNRLTERED